MERVSISHPNTQKSIEILLQQRFTMAPGGAVCGDQTGTWVWPTTRILLDHLLQQETLSQIRQVNTDNDNNNNNSNQHSILILELGAGCGLLGMALAAFDRHVTVTLTDHDGNMEWLRQNLKGNHEA
jgi:hypothetical protein